MIMKSANNHLASWRPLSAIVALLGCLFLTQCGRQAGETTPSAGANGGKPKVLTLRGMADYFSPAVLERFEKETGVHVEYLEYEDPDSVEGELRSDSSWADLVVVDSFNLNKLRKVALLHPLDRAQVPNLENADPAFLNLGCDPGNQFSVPYHWGTTLLAYRKDRVTNPQRSWKLLWEPSLAGKVMMLDDSFEPMAVAMILNGERPDTTKEEAWSAARTMLYDHFRQQSARYGSDADIKDALAAGDVDVAMCYSGDAAALAAEHDTIDFFIPQEGASQWVDCLCITRDTKLSAEAHQFVNFFLRPDVAAENTNYIRYASTNKAATPLIAQDLRDDTRIYPEGEVMKRCVLVPLLDTEVDSLVNRHWYELKAQINDDNAAKGEPATTAVDTSAADAAESAPSSDAR